MLFMTLNAFLIISVHKILYFMHFSQKRDIHTDRPTLLTIELLSQLKKISLVDWKVTLSLEVFREIKIEVSCCDNNVIL